MYSFSNELADVLKRYLESNKWEYVFNDRTGVFEFGARIVGKIQRLNYVVDVGSDWMEFYGLCPVAADSSDQEQMLQVMEFICRINFGLRNGCFEFDCDRGEIRYKSFIDCKNLMPSMEVIQESLRCIAIMFSSYSSSILNIIFLGKSAKEEFAKYNIPDNEQSS